MARTNDNYRSIVNQRLEDYNSLIFEDIKRVRGSKLDVKT